VIKTPAKQRDRGTGPGRGSGRGRGVPPRPSARKGRNNAPPRCEPAAPTSVVEQVPADGLLRHQEITRAHQDAITAIAMAEDAVYTAARDKSLRRWRVRKGVSGLFELAADLEVPLGESCWTMLHVGEWIFCGLSEGTIQGFSKSGQSTTLKAHSKRVTCLLVHQNVLISGSHDGTVRLWQAQVDGGPQAFACTHTVSADMPGAINCMRVLGERLWVGGMSGLAVLDLAQLRVTNQLPPRKCVTSFLEFTGHMITVYADGSTAIYDGMGNQTHSQTPLAPGPVLCIAGLESGPRVLLGHSKGQVSSIELPSFNFKLFFQAVDRCKVESICAVGHDGIFLIGAQNGNLQLWQRVDTAGL